MCLYLSILIDSNSTHLHLFYEFNVLLYSVIRVHLSGIVQFCDVSYWVKKLVQRVTEWP